MAMSIASGAADEPMLEMNTTPLIDVMLVLLIMFIITLPLTTHVTTLDLPGKPAPAAAKPEVITLDIEFDGTIVWNGAVLESMAQLDRYFRVAAAREVQPELHVRPDKRAEYDKVAQVLAGAQRNGLQRIGIIGP